MARPRPAIILNLFLTFLLFTLTTAKKVTNPKNPPRNAILLSKVESLTFRSGRMTTNRRVPAVPQMSCIGPPSVCDLYTIPAMRCTNEGSDYEKENIQWACRADLPEEFKLGSTDVACEGYESADDPYVLKGSCGVEYRMLLTQKGEDRFGRIDDGPHGGHVEDSGPVAKVVVFAIFGFVLFIILSGLLRACRRNPPRLGGGGGAGGPPWSGGGGGGGDDDVDDPPPPYDAPGYGQPPKKSRPNNTNTRTGSGSSSGSGSQQQGWRPGPWTAGLAGAGLGYALGRGQNRTQPSQPARRGGFFGDGGGPSSPRPSSPPTFSSSRHSSTGFGGTSRR